jgi:hypothetical protein
LKACLEIYKKNESDGILWDLLPIAYAAAFFSKVRKEGRKEGRKGHCRKAGAF